LWAGGDRERDGQIDVGAICPALLDGERGRPGLALVRDLRLVVAVEAPVGEAGPGAAGRAGLAERAPLVEEELVHARAGGLVGEVGVHGAAAARKMEISRSVSEHTLKVFTVCLCSEPRSVRTYRTECEHGLPDLVISLLLVQNKHFRDTIVSRAQTSLQTDDCEAQCRRRRRKGSRPRST
jgi:hypothetical protein